ncbi:outer membrane protein [Desulfobotulus alkaliphilus]|uniref:Outer membrane protein n=1 Tax=Desulfobotulus alkaliphilus TaxID=622671 RepID=A0A562RAH1_9BACT|nr:TolC family outer membrane protein [Desulfobotulus alkaliphilus]TWI66079.1 outer membrane protein [Desulfobotulus alkaliphilus]
MQFLFIPLFILFSLSAHAQPLDLVEAWRLALENDTRYQSDLHEKRAADTLKAQGLAGLLPDFSVHGSFTHSDSDRFNKYETRSYGVTLRQPLIHPERYFHYKKTGFQAEAGGVAFAISAAELKLRVAEAYFDLLAAADQEALLLAEKGAVARQLEQARAMQAGGLVDLADLHETMAVYQDVLSRITEAASTRRIREGNLHKITGVPVSGLYALSESALFDLPELSLEDWKNMALKHNLTIRYREFQLDMARQDRNMAASRYGPTVEAVFQYRDTNESTHYRGAEDTIASAAVQMNWPLFSGGSTRARVKETRAMIDRYLSDLEGARREAEHRVSEAYANIEGAVARMKALAEFLHAAEVALESVARGVAAGIRTPVDVLDAERRIYDTRNRLLKARYDYVVSHLALLFHAGVLGDDDLETFNRMLAPAIKE